MLRYAKVSNRLFFTTALQDAVQTYDLEGATLSDSAYEHPTPPNAFAVSSTSHLLLSASDSPPVIQLTNLLLGTRPLLLRPQCSSASVVVAEFHPERGNIFLLAFADGTCAVYDAAYIFRDGRGERSSGASASEVRWEVSHIKGLHTPSKLTSTTKSVHDTDAVHVDPALGHKHARGITAAAFIPEYKTTVITAGSDGKCCLLDFAASEVRNANLIRFWEIGGLPTSLTLLALGPQDGASLPIAGLRDLDTHERLIYVAIGCQDSKVFIFNLYGNLLWEQAMFQGGPGILDVEWMEGDDWPQPVPSRPAHARIPKSKSSSSMKSPGSVLAGGRTTAEEIVAVLDDVDADDKSAAIRSVGQSNGVGTDNAAFNHMDLPSLMDSLYPPRGDHEDGSDKTETTSSESLGTMMRNFQFPVPPIHNVPPVPPLGRRGVGQLPRNNSWATESSPNNQALQRVLDANSIEAYLDKSGVNESVLTNSIVKTQPPLKSPPLLTSSEAGPSGNSEVTRRHEDAERKHTGPSADRPGTNQEDLWTDITFDDVAPIERHDLGFSDKENNLGKDYALAPKDQGFDHSITKSSNRQAPPKVDPGGGFTIFVDKKDRKDHPQPLSANPSKAPVSNRRQPLAPASTNTSRLSPTVRAPWYRQKARNGSGGENHRSSIYGPGALARKIQQEVMITVSVELDVLRREMNERFAFQKAEFEFEIKKSQVWTLTVEDENRKLREELAKERKRREGEKGRERLNLC
ncbi:MAG: hypothetical protein Q9221_004060 [Calogaya cf. arnoldii]